MLKMVNKVRDRKGFTLIELLIVVAIIGILAAIAIPAFLGQQKKAKSKSLSSSGSNAAKSAAAMLSAASSRDPFVILSTSSTKICYAHAANLQVDSDADSVPDMDACQAKYNEIYTAAGGQGTYGEAVAANPRLDARDICTALYLEACGTAAVAAIAVGQMDVAAPFGGLGKVSPYDATKCIFAAPLDENAGPAFVPALATEGTITCAYSDTASSIRIIMHDDDGNNAPASFNGETTIFMAAGSD